MNRHRKTAKRRHHFKQYDSTLLFRVLEHKERFCLVEKVLVPPKKKKKSNLRITRMPCALLGEGTLAASCWYLGLLLCSAVLGDSWWTGDTMLI